MAESVALRQERKLIFYEELKSSGVFGDKNNMKQKDKLELKRLMKQEESFEIKINSPLKTIDDYSEYIKFKKTLFYEIANRGKHANTLKVQHLKYSLTAQIKKLYSEGLNLFPHEISFWEAYIKFCRITKFHTDGSAAYEKLLSFHGDKPKFWLDAVQWESEETRNMEKAKNLLLSAIDKHPECSNLYIKLFKILLSLANCEQSADYRLAITVFDNTKNCDFKIDYWAKILEITEEYVFTKKLQELLVGYLIDKFANSELAWHILAQRELKGFSTGDIIRRRMGGPIEDDYIQEKDEKMETDRDEDNGNNCLNWCEQTSKRRLELCSEVYQSAVRVVNTEKMWTYYIDAMLELNKDTGTEKALKWKLLESAFRGALAAQQLTENHFRAYIHILGESDADDREILKVVEKGPSLYPNSAMPWEVYMCHFIIQDQQEEVNKIFRKACKELSDPDKTYPLWRIMLQYYQTLPDKYDYVYKIYSEACNQTSKIFLPFRVLYLEFCIINKQPQEVRDLYEKLTLLTPPYLELHRKMASFESVSLNPDITHWRKCHQNAVRFFGEERADVWIDYMNFEKDHGDPTKISEIYREASETIRDKKKFLNNYNILNAISKLGDESVLKCK